MMMNNVQTNSKGRKDLYVPHRRISVISFILSFYLLSPVQSFLPHVGSKTNSALVVRHVLSKEDSGDHAEPLALTADDLSRLSDSKSRHCTIPIMIFDAMLPRQRLSFKSDDAKFRSLVEHCLKDNESDQFKLGMLGLNPYTGKPLCRGVTLSVSEETVHFDSKTKVITMLATGQKRFEVQGEPWLDESGSFYMADIERMDDRTETMTSEHKEEAERLSSSLPEKINEWVGWVIKSEATDKLGMEARLLDLGPMPTDLTERALWTAALVNPLPALDVCLEIRPAMLSCSNDLERMILASQAVESSIDHMSGKNKLF